MSVDLFGIAGLDAESPDAHAAREDAQEFENLVRCLLAAREAGGKTQTQVAQEMGTGQSAVSTFERLGTDPRYSTIQRYARAAGARVRTVVLRDGWRDERRVHATTSCAAGVAADASRIQQTVKPSISLIA